MRKYHDDIVSSSGNLTNEQETTDQTATVESCTRSLWLTEVAPYIGPDVNSDIVVSPTSPEKVLATFCTGNEQAPACRAAATASTSVATASSNDGRTAATQRACQTMETAYTNDASNPASLASDVVTALQQLENNFPEQKPALDSLIARAQSNPGLASVVFFSTRDFCQKNGYGP